MENGLPFGMTLNNRKGTVTETAHRAMEIMSEAAERSGVSDMSLAEINAEISAVRKVTQRENSSEEPGLPGLSLL